MVFIFVVITCMLVYSLYVHFFMPQEVEDGDGSESEGKPRAAPRRARRPAAAPSPAGHEPAPAQPAAAKAHKPANSAWPPRPGKLVLLCNLAARPELNGRVCRAGEPRSDGSRFTVKLLGKDEEHLAVRPTSAVPHHAPPAAAAAAPETGPAVSVSLLSVTGQVASARVPLGAEPSVEAVSLLRGRLRAAFPVLTTDKRIISFELARLSSLADDSLPSLANLAAFEALHTAAAAALATDPLQLSLVLQGEAPNTLRDVSPISDFRLWAAPPSPDALRSVFLDNPGASDWLSPEAAQRPMQPQSLFSQAGRARLFAAAWRAAT